MLRFLSSIFSYIRRDSIQATTGTRGYFADLSQGGMKLLGAEIILIKLTVIIIIQCNAKIV